MQISETLKDELPTSDWIMCADTQPVNLRIHLQENIIVSVVSAFCFACVNV